MTTTTYTADRTALLIVDPYNDFHEQGRVSCTRLSINKDEAGFFSSLSIWWRSIDLSEAGGSSKEFAGHDITLEARTCRER